MSVTNVLVVDDDIAICRILHRMLSAEYKVQTSQSVADALGAIEQKPFNVYVIDYKLPDGSGFDVAERIRSKRGPAPIIIISSYAPGDIASRAEKLGISNFLRKPFSREIIRNAVKMAIGSPPVVQGQMSVSDTPDRRKVRTPKMAYCMAAVKALFGNARQGQHAEV
jgi:DNA-binding NtrC family response regulator